jgi:hypothetical protein
VAFASRDEVAEIESRSHVNALQRAVVARGAQEKMVGLSKEQVLVCMGNWRAQCSAWPLPTAGEVTRSVFVPL